jgi:hypothetical protein
MRTRRLQPGIWVGGILLALSASPSGQANNADQAVANLRQIADELTDAVKRFQVHLDREIALHDRGYIAPGGGRIPGADIDLNGPAEAVQAAVRKLNVARMLAARRPGYDPIPLSDCDHIQQLIAEARIRIEAANGVMRRLYVVSAADLSPAAQAAAKVSHNELLKARSAATEAAKKALMVLPLPMPEADSTQEQREKVWDVMLAGSPARTPRPDKTAGTPERKTALDKAIFPVHFEQGKRITLINEPFLRVALTDSGMEDPQGRRLFFEEEWAKRTGNLARTATSGSANVVVMMRWAVAVNTKTGQHTMLRRYWQREFQGDLDEIYQTEAHRSLVPVRAPVIAVAQSAQPSLGELGAALADVARARSEIEGAVQNFRQQTEEALARNDALLAAREEAAPDGELQPALRRNIFTIRAQLAEVTGTLDAEEEIRRAAERAAEKVQRLEALAAWVNGNALDLTSPAHDSRAWLDFQRRSDNEIEAARTAGSDALAMLPPDLSGTEEQFPALRKDLVVRIRRLPAPAVSAAIFRCKQEVWHIVAFGGASQVKRAIVFIDIDPKTGSQIPTGGETKYYRMEPGDTLEAVYDEYSSQ